RLRIEPHDREGVELEPVTAPPDGLLRGERAGRPPGGEGHRERERAERPRPGRRGPASAGRAADRHGRPAGGTAHGHHQVEGNARAKVGRPDGRGEGKARPNARRPPPGERTEAFEAGRGGAPPVPREGQPTVTERETEMPQTVPPMSTEAVSATAFTSIAMSKSTVHVPDRPSVSHSSAPP